MSAAVPKSARSLKGAASLGRSINARTLSTVRRPGSSNLPNRSFSSPHVTSLAVASVRSFHHGPETVIPSVISTSSPDFLEKAEAMDKLVADLEEHLSTARLGGGVAALDKMRSRGKKTPRERLSLLLDKDSPFIELSSLAAQDVYPGQHVPGAGLITGIGRIAGRECMVVVNDASVKGGSYLPLTVSSSDLTSLPNASELSEIKYESHIRSRSRFVPRRLLVSTGYLVYT